jgi:hypothetical protein
VKKNLINSDKWVGRSLIALWERQTEDEKSGKYTEHTNRVGFNKFDADLLSSFAEQYKKKDWLSAKQLEIARKRLLKYAVQLARIANKEV